MSSWGALPSAEPLAEADADADARRPYAKDARVYYVGEATTFFGERRTYMGQRVLDEAATAAGADERRRRGSRTGPAADHVDRSRAFEWYDAYQDTGYTQMHVDPDERAQIERDMGDARFHAAVDARRISVHGAARERAMAERAAAAAASAAERRVRADVAAALAAAAGERALLSLDYLRGVPRALAAAFVATPEVQALVRTLVPELYVPHAERTHVSRAALIAAMGSPGGAEFRSIEHRTLVGHALEHAPADETGAASSLYAGTARTDEHWHYDATTNTTRVAVLTFRCVNVYTGAASDAPGGGARRAEPSALEALAASAEPLVGSAAERRARAERDVDAVEAAAEEARRERPCYLVDVVAHVVDDGSSGDEEQLCVRSFFFHT